jgi:hypothetical protein
MNDNLIAKLRDYRERFIFQGDSEYACRIADALEAQAKRIAELEAALLSVLLSQDIVEAKRLAAIPLDKPRARAALAPKESSDD